MLQRDLGGTPSEIQGFSPSFNDAVANGSPISDLCPTQQLKIDPFYLIEWNRLTPSIVELRRPG